jgi:hypothetical protein
LARNRCTRGNATVTGWPEATGWPAAAGAASLSASAGEGWQAAIVMAASEVARRSPGLGGLIASLPLVSILAMIWLWQDTADTQRVAAQSEATFWFVLP